MKFSVIIVNDKLDTTNCVVDERVSNKGTSIAYSGIDNIIEALIRRNNLNGKVHKHTIDIDLIDRHRVKYEGKLYKGLWTETETGYCFKTNVSGNYETERNIFPGVKLEYRMYGTGEEHLSELTFIVNNTIFCNIIRCL